jgi:hypothetical protein
MTFRRSENILSASILCAGITKYSDAFNILCALLKKSWVCTAFVRGSQNIMTRLSRLVWFDGKKLEDRFGEFGVFMVAVVTLPLPGNEKRFLSANRHLDRYRPQTGP